MKLFRNRRQAAEELARDLAFLKAENPIVLGLARGGVPIAEIVAHELGAPLDVLLFERLFAPSGPSHVVGVVDEHGRISMIQNTARWHHVTSKQLVEPARRAFRELQHRRARIRAILPELDLHNRTVIIVSHGIGTGAKMLGAIASCRDRGAAKIVAAAPAGHSKATWQLHDTANLVVIPHQPTQFTSVERFYEEYMPVTDEVMLGIIERWVANRPTDAAHIKTIVLRISSTRGDALSCELDLPPEMKRGSGPYPAVVFAHGFESNARSQRSVPISLRLAKRGIIGVRPDFTGHGRSEGAMELATNRQMLEDLHTVVQQITQLHEVDATRIGLNGSGTGGMIALHYAAQQRMIRAMVIRGPVCGREIQAARKVTAPTLIIHAERDTALKEPVDLLDRELAATHELLVIPNSNRMFNDPISLELMVSASTDWLADHLLTAPTVETVGPIDQADRRDGSATRAEQTETETQTRST